ncbi:MAG: hypothetical protein WCG25_07570 [bacterium]
MKACDNKAPTSKFSNVSLHIRDDIAVSDDASHIIFVTCHIVSLYFVSCSCVYSCIIFCRSTKFSS